MKKSLTELRTIAQSMKIPFSFADTMEDLENKIKLEAAGKDIPKPQPVPRNPYDARLMTRRPNSRVTSREEIEEVLKGHTARGLKIEYPDEERWKIRFEKKEDSGTFRMPIRDILRCADKMLR